jgi:hypothetical protein
MLPITLPLRTTSARNNESRIRRKGISNHTPPSSDEAIISFPLSPGGRGGDVARNAVSSLGIATVTSGPKDKIVVGVDFGTTYSG